MTTTQKEASLSLWTKLVFGSGDWSSSSFGTLLLFSAVAMAWFYPLTRERHARIRKLLARRKERATH